WPGVGGPLARHEEQFHALYEERRPVYDAVADAAARNADDAVLGAAGIHVAIRALQSLWRRQPGDAPLALVADAHVAGIYGASVQPELGRRLSSTHEGAGKSPEELTGLWRSLGSLRIGE